MARRSSEVNVAEGEQVRAKAKPDAEFGAMKRIMRILESLPAGSRSRVLAYCAERCHDSGYGNTNGQAGEPLS